MEKRRLENRHRTHSGGALKEEGVHLLSFCKDTKPNSLVSSLILEKAICEASPSKSRRSVDLNAGFVGFATEIDLDVNRFAADFAIDDELLRLSVLRDHCDLEPFETKWALNFFVHFVGPQCVSA